MSLWSPVDLVAGGAATRNNNLVHNTNNINVQHYRIDKPEEKPKKTTSLLYDHLIRRNSSRQSDNNNVLSKNSILQTNCNVMPISEQSSNAQLNSQEIKDSTKKCNDNSHTNSLQNLSSGISKRIQLKDLIDVKHLPFSTNSVTRNYHSYHQSQQISSSPSPSVFKFNLSNEVSENCDKNRTSEKMNNDEDCSMPLNLCIKKPRKENENDKSTSNNHHEKSKVVLPQLTATNTTTNASHFLLPTQPRKRGRKPKSLLANNFIASHTAVAPIDIKPRKRGRPPTLSPPLSHQLQQPTASLINKPLHLPSSGAFQHHQYQFPVLNTPLQPGWPTLSSTGQLIFPDKVNGSQCRDDNKKRRTVDSFKPEASSSDNYESLASDSAVDEDSGEDSETGSQSSENKFGDRREQGHRAVDEREIRLPFQFGWRRQTKIRCFSRSGVRGEVIYITPCGKKLKGYPDVVRYLTKHGITNIKKENFNFSSKINVGEFFERVDENEISLSESEVISRINEIRKRRRSRIFPFSLEKTHKDASLEHDKDTQVKNSERTREMIPRDAKRLRLEEMKRLKEHELILKEHEKFEKLEIMRLEKIVKAQQIDEMRKKRREELERQRQEELLRKAQERELKRQQTEFLREQEMQKRRELLIMADLERERRRQHMMLVRALEAHKKQEERERKREEILAEKRAIQEKKIQKRKLEMELLKELKKPMDDMMLKNLQPIPTLNRIPGLKLPAKAFADCLMVYEFLSNFGETLGFDMDSLPSLNTFQLALLNLDESAEDELLSIIHHLLVCAIEDPGIPTNVVTVMGQKLKDAPITNYNITEMLRLYFLAFDCAIREDAKEQRLESRMVKLLSNAQPFLSLTANHKAEILSFLCNELLCNQAIVKRIDENIETVTNLRRDKWVCETELRKWKTIKLKREKKTEQEQEEGKKNEMEDGEEESGESENEENVNNGSNANINAEAEEEPDFTNEEIDKKIDKLNKQFNQINNKLNKATNTFRVTPLGQDRYRRRFWVLPNSGGVFVEGLESGEPDEAENNLWNEDELKNCENGDKSEIKTENGIKEDEKLKIDEDEMKKDKDGEEEKQVLDEKQEQTDIKSEENLDQKMEVELKKEEPEELKKETVIEEEEPQEDKPKNLVVEEKPIFEERETKLHDKKEANDSKNKEEQKGNSSWMSHSLFASMLAGSMMFGNNFSSNNGITSQLPFPFPFGLDFGSNKSNQTQKNWFSILPRVPCDDKTITEHHKTNACGSHILENLVKSKKEKQEKTETTEKTSKHQDSAISSLMNGLPSNLFMQAFLYPHILSSFLNQQSLGGGGPCPPDASPFSVGSSAMINGNSSTTLDQEKINSATPTQSCEEQTTINLNQIVDVDVCPALQRRIAQQKEQLYEKPQKIQLEYQLGWWRITDSSQLKALLEILDNRGVREKQLQKHLQKYLNYAIQSCKSNVAELEITDLDRTIAENCAFGAPKSGLCSHKFCQDFVWCREVALRFDIAVLEQIETLEEKIATSSMQIRNWKPSQRISCDDRIKFKPAACFINNEGLQSAPDSDSKNLENEEVNNSSANSNRKSRKSDSGDVNPVAAGKERLLALEAVIERRYLKPPLGFKSNTILISLNDSGQNDDYDNAADENATSGLLRWREAVREAQSSAEIALCLHFLEGCIAWDKSIMRASCQFCGSGENEAQLLLCDGCDKGYHTYCFKPKMETIPDGDWFCFECQNKNTIDKVCIVCGKKGKLLNCDSCPKVFHPNCLDPPVTKPLKGKWTCHMCARKPKKFSQQKFSKKFSSISSLTEEKQKETSRDVSISSGPSPQRESKKQANSSKNVEKEQKKERKSKEHRNDLSICLNVLNEMEKHEDAWPFLLPVNTKQFPTYKKIIKKPMDTHTIRQKIERGEYKNKEEFVSDVRLIFDNCETFNEDESPVGQAGHNLRAFFEMKWKEFGGS